MTNQVGGNLFTTACAEIAGGDGVLGHLALYALALRHRRQVRGAVAQQEISGGLAGRHALGDCIGVLLERIAIEAVAAR